MDEREFELVNILGRELGSNQRDLSRQMELSLGMINMLIRRLISKGYIRIEQLNKRNVKYILTAHGLSEKMRQSVKYTLNTINSIGLIKDNVKDLLTQQHKAGRRRFYLYCQSDLTFLVETAFREAKLQDSSIQILKALPENDIDGVLLTGYENIDLNGFNRKNHLDLLKEIAKTDLAIL
ncbi:MAG: winged helix-turn-helix transcriptional regulator [Candidatus Omnitrophica bacterium]|nr:winged helix-turn-helix transcriptional regulator [Candidatus Omnitrophota bacterium]